MKSKLTWEEILTKQLPHGFFFLMQEEFQFHLTRKWRADIAAWRCNEKDCHLPTWAVIIEVEGGTWAGLPSHSSGKGIARDMEKSNEAQALGYKYFRFTPAQMRNGEAAEFLKRVLP